jgi:hypothetical protein
MGESNLLCDPNLAIVSEVPLQSRNPGPLAPAWEKGWRMGAIYEFTSALREGGRSCNVMEGREGGSFEYLRRLW